MSDPTEPEGGYLTSREREVASQREARLQWVKREDVLQPIVTPVDEIQHRERLWMTLSSIARGARDTARLLARVNATIRADIIREVGALLDQHRESVKVANAIDVSQAQQSGLSSAMIDRLLLTDERIDELILALNQIAELPDPLGEISQHWTRPNGLEVSKMRLPIGVILMIYESRPNVTLDAAALCLKSGNCAILRGGSESIETNRTLFALIQRALVNHGAPIASVQMLPTQDRGAIDFMLQMSEEIDLVIPRGGAELIRRVVARSRIPVIRHDRGVCHIYVEESADLDTAVAICLNAKVQRPGVCNAMETLLIDREIAPSFLPQVIEALLSHQVALKLCERSLELINGTDLSQGNPSIIQAIESDWGTEFLSLTLAIRMVDSLDEAIQHIDRYGSRHSAAILTQREALAERFTKEVDASCVLVNTSTRFNDGGALGLGAEIGISTTRIHAFGPMGVEALTAEKFVVKGQGQVRE